MSNQLEKDFKELQNKNQKIAEGAIKINTQIETAQLNYQKLQELAVAKFGTSDIDSIKELMEKWKKSNQDSYDLAYEKVKKLESNYNETVRLIKDIQEGQQ